ncbi:MAG: helix-turn-helix domain-containing protein [Planctomycetota bacterium]
MAKMFISIAEAAQMLGKSEGEVQGYIDSNQLEAFKQGDEFMLKREQVEALGGMDSSSSGTGLSLADSGGPVGLMDDLEPLDLASSGSGPGLDLGADPAPTTDLSEATGISIFDPEDTESADPNQQTQVTATNDFADLAGDFGGADASGSGLLDLTREADDTSLGLDSFGQETVGGTTPGDIDPLGLGDTAGGGDLFETTPETAAAPTAAAPAGAAMVPAPAFDGPGSGLVGGLTFAMTVACLVALAITLLAMVGAGELLKPILSLDSAPLIVGGGLAGLTLIAGLLGMFVFGRR